MIWSSNCFIFKSPFVYGLVSFPRSSRSLPINSHSRSRLFFPAVWTQHYWSERHFRTCWVWCIWSCLGWRRLSSSWLLRNHSASSRRVDLQTYSGKPSWSSLRRRERSARWCGAEALTTAKQEVFEKAPGGWPCVCWHWCPFLAGSEQATLGSAQCV